MLSDAFEEFGQTRVPMPGDLATVSVSLEYDAGKQVDEVCARAAKLGAELPIFAAREGVALKF